MIDDKISKNCVCDIKSVETAMDDRLNENTFILNNNNVINSNIILSPAQTTMKIIRYILISRDAAFELDSVLK